ncbi:hypothetical protein JSY14_10115 [Brachybacterium sp. EF45031]|uniref:tetratricopeptide repeat protein n=1 Tax=Brachybacterium sillae TaxID=2810536 RepID=UPI00217E8396|nr:tetratricopeptide repeat protein [Brachybacterium sillae]MCS6712359.1 hypothetical protein [Brachybacterium sillae]
MRGTLLVAGLVLVTAAYCWGLGWIAWGFWRAGGVVGGGLALATLLFLLLSVWVTWREVRFGLASAHLVAAVPVDHAAGRGGLRHDLPRPQRQELARQEFDRAREVAAGPDATWPDWVRLARAYDDLGDRRHAREAMRRAIALERTARR